ncbi:MAG: hypothetical protein ABI359_13340 [Ginsengibacter sp.]
MMKITSDDLIKYLYNETSEQKSATIQTALQTDWSLREMYEKLLNSQSELKKIKFSPRRETVNKILDYASKRHIPVTSH